VAARKAMECEQDFSPASPGTEAVASTLRAEVYPFVDLVSVSVVVDCAANSSDVGRVSA